MPAFSFCRTSSCSFLKTRSGRVKSVPSSRPQQDSRGPEELRRRARDSKPLAGRQARSHAVPVAWTCLNTGKTNDEELGKGVKRTATRDATHVKRHTRSDTREAQVSGAGTKAEEPSEEREWDYPEGVHVYAILRKIKKKSGRLRGKDGDEVRTGTWAVRLARDRRRGRGDLPTNAWHLKHSSSHSGVTTCFTTEMAVRNLTVRVTLLATRCVHFCADSAISPPRTYSFWGARARGGGEPAGHTRGAQGARVPDEAWGSPRPRKAGRL